MKHGNPKIRNATVGAIQPGKIVGANGSSLKQGINDLTNHRHDYVTRDEVARMVLDVAGEVIREAMNVAIRKMDEAAQEREAFSMAELKDELVKLGVYPEAPPPDRELH